MLCKNCFDRIPSHIMSRRYCCLKCELEAVPPVETIEGIDDMGKVLKKVQSMKAEEN